MIKSEHLRLCALAAGLRPTSDRTRFYMRVMSECLQRSGLSLVQVAEAALQTALLYWWHSQGSISSVTDARVACWEHLKAAGEDTTLATPEVIGVRAVICVLYADPEEDEDFLEQTIEWFSTLLNKLGNHSKDFEEALEKASGDPF